MKNKHFHGYRQPNLLPIYYFYLFCRKILGFQTLAARRDAYVAGHPISGYDCVKLLLRLKDEHPWLKGVDSTALQASVLHMDQAYKNFFTGRKGKRRVGSPRSKAKHRSRASYTSKAVGQNIRVADSKVKLPKPGWVKARVSTPAQGHLLNATVSMTRSSKFFVSLCCTEVVILQLPGTGAAVGLDVGIKDLAITSDDQKFGNPMHLRQEEKRLTRLQRRLSQKSKDSWNREKTRVKLARQMQYAVLSEPGIPCL